MRDSGRFGAINVGDEGSLFRRNAINLILKVFAITDVYESSVNTSRCRHGYSPFAFSKASRFFTEGF